MSKHTGKEEFHNSYLEFNEAKEGMIRHKNRSGASAAAIHLLQSVALIPATLMGGLVVGLLLMTMLVPGASSLVPQLISHTHNSALVQVESTDVTKKLAKTVYLDLFTKGFFDPRRTAELAVELLGGAYYRMQPQVRN